MRSKRLEASLPAIDLDALEGVTGGARQSHELQKLQTMASLLGAVAAVEKNQTDLQAAQMGAYAGMYGAQMQANAAMYGAQMQAQSSMMSGMFGMMGNMFGGMGGGGGGGGMI